MCCESIPDNIRLVYVGFILHVNRFFQEKYKRLALTGFGGYSSGMKALITYDQKVKIAEKIINGESPEKIANDLQLKQNHVLSVLGDSEFSAKLLNLFKNQARGIALLAHQNIVRIAFDIRSSAATQLKASKILVDIAREMEELHPNDLEPANMTQAQLADRLKALQKEALNRAKPIDTGVIEQEIDLDSMV